MEARHEVVRSIPASSRWIAGRRVGSNRPRRSAGNLASRFHVRGPILIRGLRLPRRSASRGNRRLRGAGDEGSIFSKLTVTYINPATGRSVETVRMTISGSSRLVLPGGGTIISAGWTEETILLDPETWRFSSTTSRGTGISGHSPKRSANCSRREASPTSA
jgi:hypothetical protein